MTSRPAAVAAAAVVVLLPSIALAQTMDGKGRGLDALDEHAVMARLASDGLTHLLDRDFDLFKVPPAERDQQRAVIQLQALADAGGLKPADRRAAAEKVAKDIDPMVAKATDAAALQQQAYLLTTAGLDPTVTELEYFGDNPAAQAQLEPVAAVVRHMFQQAAGIAGRQADQLKATITDANITAVRPKLVKASNTRRFAAFNYDRTGYALCISLPPGDPARARVADASIAALKQYDTPRSTIQAGVRVLIGKLQLAKADYPAAKATLDSVANAPAGSLTPPPTPAEQNEARYFAAVADLLAGRLDDVANEATALIQWQDLNYLPSLTDDAARDRVKAGDAMLTFRLRSAQADADANPAAKQKLNDQAVTTLTTLLDQQNDPTLRDLVFDQLVTRIPPHPDMAKLDPLALLALQQQGYDQYNKKEGEPIDKPVLERAIAAARELARRAGQPGVTAAAAVNAAYFVPYALETKLHDDPSAADAYMDFMQQFPNETDKAQDCMEHAGAVVFRLHNAAVARNAPDPVEAKLYDRFLPLAIAPPFDQKQVAIDYADILRGQGKYGQAVKYYGMVPPTDKRYGAARFRELLALFSALGDTTDPLPADQRKADADQLQTLAAEVDQTAEAAASAAKTDADRQAPLGQVAIARYDAAISARRDLKDPAKSLQWLDGFDQKIAGLNNAKAFGQTVLVQRVNAYMDQGKTADATAALVPVLQADPAAGEGLLFDLIHQIDHDLDVAKGAHDVAAQKQLAANKANLSGFLVTYAQQSHDPKTQAQLPAYRLYDADSKRQAAELSDDPADRVKNLEAALKQYQALTGTDATPAVQLGVGLTDYDLGHYKDAVTALSPLVSKRLIGQPTMQVNGQTVENPQFWEATYKQLRSISEVAHAAPADAAAHADAVAAKRYLANLFIIYGGKTGGAGYRDDFAKLRDEMAAVK